LVRQAAGFLDLSRTKYCALTARGHEVTPGTYHFTLYRWTKHGIRPDESLVAVADDPEVEASLFDLLQSARDAGDEALPDVEVCNSLDVRHHAKWSAAQANYMAQNRELAEHRIQSLTVSHRARCKAIEDQVRRATNDKIRLMKDSELARANVDFDRRIEEINLAVAGSDIRTAPVVFGSITVTKEGSE
jgi:hypothetical protein